MARVAKRDKEVAETSKRIARMKKEKARAKMEGRPDWLPEGWIVDVRAGRDGRKLKHYTLPGSGLTFCSKQKVLHFLEVKNVGGDISDTSFSEHNKSTVAAQAMNSPEWLPHGWILEIKTRARGAKAGTKYKCYFDPVSGSRFFSKVDVLNFLKSGPDIVPTSRGRKHSKASTTDNVLAQIEYSPDGLPPGWIKEIIYRKSNSNSKGIRTKGDPYYTDPVTGYVFRSLTEAVRYVKTGEPGNYASGHRKRNFVEMYSIERESPPPISAEELKSLGSTTRRPLFTEEASTSNCEVDMEINGSTDKPCLPPPDHALSENFHKDDPTSPPDTELMKGKLNKKRRQILESESGSPMNASKHVERKAKRGRPIKTMPGLAVESGGMVVERDEPTDKPQLPHSDLASPREQRARRGRPTKTGSVSENENKGGGGLLEPTAATEKSSEPANGSKHVEQKAKRGRPIKTMPGLAVESGGMVVERDEPTDKPQLPHPDLASSSREQRARRGRPTKTASIYENENKGGGGLLEPTAATEKSPEPAGETTPVYQERTQRRSKSKSLTLPRRSSKRLAGLEPEASADLTIRRPPCQPTSSGAVDGTEEPVTLSEHERMDETVTLSEPERMDTVGEAHPPLSNGVCKHDEGPAPLPEPERMDTVGEAHPPLSNGVCKHDEGPAPLPEPEMMDAAGEASRPLTTGVCNGTEGLVPLDSAGGPPQPPSDGMHNGIEEPAPLTERESTGTAEAAHPGGQLPLTGQTAEDQFSLPFSDFWADPCIQFAVKTLTGEIPVLDEGLAIAEYVQRHLALNTNAPAAASDHQGQGQGPAEPPKKQHLPASEEGKQFPVKNGLPPRSGAASPKVKG